VTLAQIDETHDPALTSWVESANGHADFPIQNLPYGIFSPQGGQPRPGVAIGDRVLDLAVAAQTGLLPGFSRDHLSADSLNVLMARPADERRRLRQRLSAMLSKPAHRTILSTLLHEQASVALHLPARIGDYTDFYVGVHHASNVGRLFRPDNPLLPNYKHVPIGYHGRASSIRPSGAPVVRPMGQIMPPNAEAPVFGPTARLDYELELGVWIGRGNVLGEPIEIAKAQDHVAGFCLLNDWSARDIQAWEYQPLGPFLAKSFHSTISPWIVTAEAMAPFHVAQPPRPDGDPRPLNYLWNKADQAGGALAVDLEVRLLTPAMRRDGAEPYRLSHGPASNMYWTVAQILTHHTSNGCNLNPGDLLGTGTISAPERSGFGSLLEITEGGAKPLTLPNGETRKFLEDGDEVLMSARAQAPGRVSIGFGACRAVITPATRRVPPWT
jgi:fumarylacetoacetase